MLCLCRSTWEHQQEDAGCSRAESGGGKLPRDSPLEHGYGPADRDRWSPVEPIPVTIRRELGMVPDLFPRLEKGPG